MSLRSYFLHGLSRTRPEVQLPTTLHCLPTSWWKLRRLHRVHTLSFLPLGWTHGHAWSRSRRCLSPPVPVPILVTPRRAGRQGMTNVGDRVRSGLGTSRMGRHLLSQIKRKAMLTERFPSTLISVLCGLQCRPFVQGVRADYRCFRSDKERKEVFSFLAMRCCHGSRFFLLFCASVFITSSDGYWLQILAKGHMLSMPIRKSISFLNKLIQKRSKMLKENLYLATS